MWLVPFLLVFTLPVQGELKLTLEQSAYPVEDSGIVLEVSYEIPYTSLTFLREDGGFVARYEISIQVSDKRHDVSAGDLWQRVVRLPDYGSTVARDSAEVGTVSLPVPKVALDVRVAVDDMASERAALALFKIDRPTGGLTVRLYRSDKPVSMRKYGIGDTLVALAEASNPTDRLDSCRFVLGHDRRTVTVATVAATAVAAVSKGGPGGQYPATRLQARFEYPIGDSAGVARLGGGEYSLEVTGFGAGRLLKATTAFRIQVPFFLDDSAYLHRVEQLVYVASESEANRLRSVSRTEREQAWREFWRKNGKFPTTRTYVTEEEYFERIDYAEEHFRRGDRGYLSDRGHVYVVYGAASQIDSRPFEIDSPAYEVWYYDEINRKFEFVDRFGTGEYVLQNREALGG